MRTFIFSLLIVFFMPSLTEAGDMISTSVLGNRPPAERLAISHIAAYQDDSPEAKLRLIGDLLGEGLDAQALTVWEDLSDHQRNNLNQFYGKDEEGSLRLGDDKITARDFYAYTTHKDIAAAYAITRNKKEALRELEKASIIGTHRLQPGEICYYDVLDELLRPKLKPQEVFDAFIVEKKNAPGPIPGYLGCVPFTIPAVQKLTISYLRERGFKSLSNLGLLARYETPLPPSKKQPSPGQQIEGKNFNELVAEYEEHLKTFRRTLPKPDYWQRFRAVLPKDAQNYKIAEVKEKFIRGGWQSTILFERVNPDESSLPTPVAGGLLLFDSRLGPSPEQPKPKWGDQTHVKVYEDKYSPRLYIVQVTPFDVEGWLHEQTDSGYLATRYSYALR